jgi:MSHA biogenesis protein MshI
LASVLLPANTQGVINALMLNHGITARAMDITAIVDVDIMLSDSLQNICAPVIGASLRWHVEQDL